MENPERTCRFCNTRLQQSFVDLGMSPIANSLVRPRNLGEMEPFYPLHAFVCSACFLVQLEEFQTPGEIFSDYTYFSSYSESWLKHAGDYAKLMLERLALDSSSLVIEIASNDGYLLRNFKEMGIPILGIEPAKNVAEVATGQGIPTLVTFFGTEAAGKLAADGKSADLLIGNNVLAHVPDLNDFVAGMKILLNRQGVITMEFPHLERLIAENQFDTIYHEHFSYFSFFAVEKIFASHGLAIFDVQELPTHGGSLRIFARHDDENSRAISDNVEILRGREIANGICKLETYGAFGEQVRETKRKLLEFLIREKRLDKHIVGYGAPAKGNTLLNYCGIRSDFLDYTVDLSPHKQGLFLPGTRIPIYGPERIMETRPDYVLILPWNLKEEIMRQIAGIRQWGGRFVTPIPEVHVFE